MSKVKKSKIKITKTNKTVVNKKKKAMEEKDNLKKDLNRIAKIYSNIYDQYRNIIEHAGVTSSDGGSPSRMSESDVLYKPVSDAMIKAGKRMTYAQNRAENLDSYMDKDINTDAYELAKRVAEVEEYVKKITMTSIEDIIDGFNKN